MKSRSQAAALTLLDPREGHIAFQLQNFTLAAGSVLSERSNYFNVRWIKIGSGEWDLDLATFSFSSPALLFAAPYQDILLRSQEPITGVCIRFHAEFFVSKLTMKQSDATVFCLTMFTEWHWPV
jgi:AraC family transcriptional regulator, transcriptional activator of pobA